MVVKLAGKCKKNLFKKLLKLLSIISALLSTMNKVFLAGVALFVLLFFFYY